MSCNPIISLSLNLLMVAGNDTHSRFSPFWGTDFYNKVIYVIGSICLGVASARSAASTMSELLGEMESEPTSLQIVQYKPITFPTELLRFYSFA